MKGALLLLLLLPACVSPPQPGSLAYVKAQAAKAQTASLMDQVCARALSRGVCRHSLRCETHIQVAEGKWLHCEK